MSVRTRTMNAGATVRTSRNQGGGDKKQGLVSTTNSPVRLDSFIRVRGGGHNRNWLFCMNQLGGVGHRWGQAAGPGNRSGVSANCQRLAYRRRQQYPPKPCGAQTRGWGTGVKFPSLCEVGAGVAALSFSGFVYGGAAPPAPPATACQDGSAASAFLAAAKAAVGTVNEPGTLWVDLSNCILSGAPKLETSYTPEGLLGALQFVTCEGFGDSLPLQGRFYTGTKPGDTTYGLVNLAAFLGQCMQETLQYGACDENNWSSDATYNWGGIASEQVFMNAENHNASGWTGEATGAQINYPVTAACGQLGQSYEDLDCTDACPKLPLCNPVETDTADPSFCKPGRNFFTADTAAAWGGHPGPLGTSKSTLGPLAPYPCGDGCAPAGTYQYPPEWAYVSDNKRNAIVDPMAFGAGGHGPGHGVPACLQEACPGDGPSCTSGPQTDCTCTNCPDCPDTCADGGAAGTPYASCLAMTGCGAAGSYVAPNLPAPNPPSGILSPQNSCLACAKGTQVTASGGGWTWRNDDPNAGGLFTPAICVASLDDARNKGTDCNSITTEAACNGSSDGCTWRESRPLKYLPLDVLAGQPPTAACKVGDACYGQDCSWWGRGVIQTTGRCNFGRLNTALASTKYAPLFKGNDQQGQPLQSLCENPQQICTKFGEMESKYPASILGLAKELRWVAGFYYWVTMVQGYTGGNGRSAKGPGIPPLGAGAADAWDFAEEIGIFVGNVMSHSPDSQFAVGDGSGNDPVPFCTAISGLVNRGCPSPYAPAAGGKPPGCGTGALDCGPQRASNTVTMLNACFGWTPATSHVCSSNASTCAPGTCCASNAPAVPVPPISRTPPL